MPTQIQIGVDGYRPDVLFQRFLSRPSIKKIIWTERFVLTAGKAEAEVFKTGVHHMKKDPRKALSMMEEGVVSKIAQLSLGRHLHAAASMHDMLRHLDLWIRTGDPSHEEGEAAAATTTSSAAAACQRCGRIMAAIS